MAGGGTSNLIVLFAPDTPLIRKRNHQELKAYVCLKKTFSEKADDWSRAKWQGKVYREHDGGKDDKSGAEVVLHLLTLWWDTVRNNRWCLESKGIEIVPHHIHSRLEHSDIFGLNQPSTSPTFQGTHYVVTCLHFTRLVTDVKFSLSLLRTSLCSGYIWFYDVL